MIVKTRNSVYAVREEADGSFVVSKIGPDDAHHSGVRVGDWFRGRALKVSVGEPLVLTDVSEHHHPWRSCRRFRWNGGLAPLVTTLVISIKEVSP